MYKTKRNPFLSFILFPYHLLKMLLSLVTALIVATVIFTIAAVWGLGKTLTLIIETALQEFVSRVCK